jgi:hypothetical protein
MEFGEVSGEGRKKIRARGMVGLVTFLVCINV